MRAFITGLIMATACAGAALAQPASLPAAIYTDPPADAAHPAAMEVLHIPSGGVEINGVAYTAAGPGPHPTLVLLHGWPGNEKNLDLAQAVRRAGWTVVTFNYRGSWGSPGSFRFTQVPEDAGAVLAYIRRPDVAAKLRIDTRRIVLAGHSMGGWGTAVAAAGDPDLAGAILISGADMQALAGENPGDKLVAFAADETETLVGVTPQSMAEQLRALPPSVGFPALATGLARHPLLVLTADDGLAPAADGLAAAVSARKGQVTRVHAATDHGWSDHRIFLESQVIGWLQALPAR
jgi:pimeloyl-ACP methyl ester carboxylesterase